MFKVKVVGDYVARSGVMEKEKIKRPYEIEGVIPTAIAALSVVKNKLLGPALAKKYTDYVTFLTYHIVSITPMNKKAEDELATIEINYMDRPSLLKYIKINNVGRAVDEKSGTVLLKQLVPEYYPDLFKLREAVQHAVEDPLGYAKHFLLREADLRLDLEMAKCNPDLFQGEDGGFIASVSNIPEAPKALSAQAHRKNTGDRLSGLKADMVRENELAAIAPGPGEDLDI